MFIRYFWSIEVDPGSSRANSTNIFFSKWVKVCGTKPKLTDTVETMKAFLQRTSDLTLYATVYIPELNVSAQPLIYARLQDNKLQHSSVDHISNVLKRTIKDRHMGSMMSAHIRGASVSKTIQLVPELTTEALSLGRWTTHTMFRNHYQAPVIGTWTPVPVSIRINPQQVLRCSWTPQPPRNVTIAKYEKPPRFWIGKSIAAVGKIKAFDNGDYIVDER
jgi:hypothetical protein